MAGILRAAAFFADGEMAWQLGKASIICSVGLILIQFMLKREGARAVFVLFGFCSFGLMVLKEEVLRDGLQDAAGTVAVPAARHAPGGGLRTPSVLRSGDRRGMEELEVWGEFDLNETSIEEMVWVLPRTFDQHRGDRGAAHAFWPGGEGHSRLRTGRDRSLAHGGFLPDPDVAAPAWTISTGGRCWCFTAGRRHAGRCWSNRLWIASAGWSLLAVFSPFMLAAALAIKLTSPGPVFFRQQRAGLNGKPFIMYKFRSMVTDAEQLQQELAALERNVRPGLQGDQRPAGHAGGQGACGNSASTNSPSCSMSCASR